MQSVDLIALHMMNMPVLSKLELAEYNEEFTMNPDKEYKDLTDQIFVNQFLAILCTVAFTILAVGALAAASIFAPIAIPFVLLGASAAIPIFKQYVYDYFRDQELKYTHLATIQKESLELYETFKEQGNARIGNYLRNDLPTDIKTQISVDGGPPSEKALLPVLAKYQAHIDKMVSLEQAFGEAMVKLHASFRDKLKDCDPKDHAKLHQITQAHAQAVSFEYRTQSQQLLTCKVKAAWYLHLLRHPKAQGTFDSSAYLYQLSPAERLLNIEGQGSGVLPAQLANPYLGLADGTILSQNTVKKLSINDLSYAFSRGGKAVQTAWETRMQQSRFNPSGSFSRDGTPISNQKGKSVAAVTELAPSSNSRGKQRIVVIQDDPSLFEKDSLEEQSA